MATATTNLGLTKPAGTDNPDVAVINSNMDKIDTAVANKIESEDAVDFSEAATPEFSTTLDEIYQLVYDGKSKVASAITARGVETGVSDTFSVMAQNIGKLSAGTSEGQVTSTVSTESSDNAKVSTFNCTSEVTVNNELKSRIFSSAEQAEGYAFTNSYYTPEDRKPWKAFDGNASTLWSTEITDDQNGMYLGYNFHETVYNAEISLTVSTDNAGTPKFKLQGCESPTITDDSVWEDVSDEVTLNAYSDTHTLTYNVTNGKGYCAFRVLLLAGGRQGSTYGWAIYEMSIKGKGMEG